MFDVNVKCEKPFNMQAIKNIFDYIEKCKIYFGENPPSTTPLQSSSATPHKPTRELKAVMIFR